MFIFGLMSFILLNLLRALIFSVVGIMGIIGFLLCALFPSFWKELGSRGNHGI